MRPSRYARRITGQTPIEIGGPAAGDPRLMTSADPFVGIQHPGEASSGSNDPSDPTRYSSWPDGDAGGRPRSSTIVITKDDGGQIGS